MLIFLLSYKDKLSDNFDWLNLCGVILEIVNTVDNVSTQTKNVVLIVIPNPILNCLNIAS